MIIDKYDFRLQNRKHPPLNINQIAKGNGINGFVEGEADKWINYI